MIVDEHAVWRDGVDRWNGQAMSSTQLNRIQVYYNRSPVYEIPVWAKALEWFYTEKELGESPDLGWDFGVFRTRALSHHGLWIHFH